MNDFLEKLSRLLSRDKELLLIPIAGMTLAASSFSVVFGKSDKPDNEHVLILALAMTAVMTATLMIRYLSGSSAKYRPENHERFAIHELTKRVKDLQVQRDLVTKENRGELISELSERMKQEASAGLIIELKKQIKENEYRIKISESSKITLHRIYTEIDALGRRGSINLVLGVITALSGVVALSFFVLNDVRMHESFTEFATAFLPRLSIVVIIEVFSYFFLKLYKASLSEIKYFQNEATNIEFNFVALETAIHLGKPDLIQKTMERFINIERNPVLKKGQTTRELEVEALTEKNIKMTPDHLTEILRALINKSPSEKNNEG